MDPRPDGAVPAPLYHDEAARMAVLRDYGVLDSLPEADFDDIAFLASHICGAPIEPNAREFLVELIDQLFHADVGHHRAGRADRAARNRGRTAASSAG